MAYKIAYIHTYRVQGTKKKEFVSVFVKPLFFFELLTETDVNTVRKKKEIEIEKNK